MNDSQEDHTLEKRPRRERRQRLNLVPLFRKRWFQFSAALVTGFSLGLLYGWVINPVAYRDTALDTLHADYRTDYVLMTAEAYALSGDVETAVRQLSALGSEPAAGLVLGSLGYAESLGYSQADLASLQNLAAALQAWNPAQGSEEP